MTFNFKTGNVSTYLNGDIGLLINLSSSNKEYINELNKLLESDKEKTVEIKIYREKRSLSANAYIWTLLDKIAKKLGTTDEEVYIQMLHRYGTKEFVAGTKEMEDSLRLICKIVEPIRDCMINSTEGMTYKLIRGSSTYSVTEMQKLIEGTIDEAKALGIQTMTPNEIEKLIEEWEMVK